MGVIRVVDVVSELVAAADDLESALAHVQDGTRVPKRLARVVEVIMGFKAEAAE